MSRAQEGGVGLGKRVVMALFTVLLILGLFEVAARLVWSRLESRAFAERQAHAEEALRNDGINFLKQSDGLYGYVLKPSFAKGGHYANSQGFAQRDEVPRERRPDHFRLVAMGESTTHGHDVDTGNYPVWLRKRIEASGRYAGVEVINAGVSGWISDQVALRAEHELAAYRPDVVLLYVGWNDFQSYDPLSTPARRSYFEKAYGSDAFHAASSFKLVTLADALVGGLWNRVRVSRLRAAHRASGQRLAPPEITYRFTLASLERIVAAYQAENPEVVIALSTLVGRWPHGGREAFEATNGRTWWMQSRGVTPQQATELLARFNGLLVDFAQGREGVQVLDAAAAFATVDRSRLLWDFAHMHADGYELLAEAFYAGLLRENALQGAASTRSARLRAQYALPVASGPPAAAR